MLYMISHHAVLQKTGHTEMHIKYDAQQITVSNATQTIVKNSRFEDEPYWSQIKRVSGFSGT